MDKVLAFGERNEMIKIYRNSGGGIDVYVFTTMDGIPFESSYIGAKGIIKREKVKDGGDIKPYWKFGLMDFESFLPEFMDALIEFGVKPKKHLLTDEEKTALERHLEDMRTLVFKEKK